MKTKNYEKTTSITILLGIILLLEIIGCMNVRNIKIKEYHQIPIIMTSEKEGYVIVEKEDRKNLYKNKYLFINNHKIEYVLVEDQKIEGRKESQISIKLTKKVKQKDVVMMTIENQKINLYDMIKNAWGGDKNR